MHGHSNTVNETHYVRDELTIEWNLDYRRVKFKHHQILAWIVSIGKPLLNTYPAVKGTTICVAFHGYQFHDINHMDTNLQLQI